MVGQALRNSELAELRIIRQSNRFPPIPNSEVPDPSSKPIRHDCSHILAASLS